jgi:Bacteriophage HK97-gp10, putative tail-component
MARKSLQYGVVIEWDETQVHRFLAEPNGELGRDLMEALGQVVEDGAKRRALRRTGRMQAAIMHEVGADTAGVYVDIVSPVQDPRSGFPYATVHEGSKVRDRRPHRSLRPALRDIRTIEAL